EHACRRHHHERARTPGRGKHAAILSRPLFAPAHGGGYRSAVRSSASIPLDDTDTDAPRTRNAPQLALRALTFLIVLLLFVLAIQLMKAGGASLAPHLEVVRWNAIATLGLGALLAYLFLSGKPVAAF